MSIEAEIDGQVEQSQRLAKLLERVAELQAEKDRIAAEAKKVGKELDELEQMAVEELALSGLDGVRAAGKSWFTREFFSVSIPPEHKDRVVEIAKSKCPEYIGVNTSSLKSWLMEHRQAGGETLADGTPFAGLVREYREVRLSHRTIG
jgi:hypothetical protein